MFLPSRTKHLLNHRNRLAAFIATQKNVCVREKVSSAIIAPCHLVQSQQRRWLSEKRSRREKFSHLADAAAAAAAAAAASTSSMDEQWDELSMSSSSADPLHVTADTPEPVVERMSILHNSIVQSFYAAKSINLAALLVSDISRNAIRKVYNGNNFILCLSGASSQRFPSYVVVYQFGSVVFFNVSPRNIAKILSSVKKYGTEPVADGFERKDTFGVCVVPGATSKVTSEHCVVDRLDMNAIGVISSIMAQTVALDAYGETVNSLLTNFGTINSTIYTTGTVQMDKGELFSQIAQNNRIFIDMISKLRIKGRNEIAWNLDEYEIIHRGMTNEFEINNRFELIKYKLDLIQQNSKLFLDVLHNQKSNSLEWIIVVLIGFECILMCLEMSGASPELFASMKQMLMGGSTPTPPPPKPPL